MWVAAEATQHAREWVCALADDCDEVRIRLEDTEAPSATLWFGVELGLSRGLYVATQEESEWVFVVAHELGHRALRHQPPRDLARRLPLELEADQWAIDRLCSKGLDPTSGRALISRFLAEEKRLQTLGDQRAKQADRQRSEIAVRELSARQSLNFSCGATRSSNPAPLLDPDRFARIRRLATLVPPSR